MTEAEFPRWGRVTLKPMTQLSKEEWKVVHGFFKDRELADWNDAKPLRMPRWIFRRVMLEEENTGDRAGFAVLNEVGEVIGNAELYDFRPSAPLTATTATLGVMIGFPALWGSGYGSEAIQALLVWGFSVKDPPLQRIRLTTFGHNRRAQKAFANCGFRELGRTQGAGRTEVHMAIARSDWVVRCAPPPDTSHPLL